MTFSKIFDPHALVSSSANSGQYSHGPADMLQGVNEFSSEFLVGVSTGMEFLVGVSSANATAVSIFHDYACLSSILPCQE